MNGYRNPVVSKILLFLMIFYFLVLLLIATKRTRSFVDDPRVVADRERALRAQINKEDTSVASRENRVLNLLEDDLVDPDIIIPEVIRTAY
jgi:hypothetical protein